jgi:hypothetical protein
MKNKTNNSTDDSTSDSVSNSVPKGCLPFDREKAVAGHPVVTRCGLPAVVRERFSGKQADFPWTYPLEAYISSTPAISGIYTADGKFYEFGGSDSLDLFLSPAKAKSEAKSPKARKTLKLYIWTDFQSDYTEGLAFAIAASESEAMWLVEKEYDGSVSHWGPLEVRPLNKRVARAVPGGG